MFLILHDTVPSLSRVSLTNDWVFFKITTLEKNVRAGSCQTFLIFFLDLSGQTGTKWGIAQLLKP